ncbi:hypothetical protein [Deinococcus sp. ME38]|uniref:hypothetical protein n=1 Tax=Deinococcus sp. ME38 TaxID=3400344 RepID=UPI003B5CA9A6
MLVSAFDECNYSFKERENGELEFWFTPPAEFAPLPQASPGVIQLDPLFVFRCRRLLDGDEVLPREGCDAFWEELQASAKQLSGQQNVLPVLLAGTAVLLHFHLSWLQEDPARLQWCREVVVTAVPKAGDDDNWDTDGLTRMRWDTFAAVALPILWALKPDLPEARHAVARLVLMGGQHALRTLLLGAAERQEVLGPDFERLRHLTVSSGVVRQVIHGLRHARDANQQVLSDALVVTARLAEAFVRSELTRRLPHLDAVRRQAQALAMSAKPDLEAWHVPVDAVFPAFEWLPLPGAAQDEREQEQHRREVQQLLMFVLPPTEHARFGLPRKTYAYKAPREHEEWVLLRAGAMAAHLSQDDRPEDLWEPLLALGREGEGWLAPFLKAFASEVLSMSVVSEQTMGTWHQLLKATLSVRRPDGGLDWFSSEVLLALLGIDAETGRRWQPRHAELVLRYQDGLKFWADQALTSPNASAQFAWFLRQPAAAPLRAEGLVWLVEASRGRSEYWLPAPASAVMRLLQEMWDARGERPFVAGERAAFRELLARLVEMRVPQAILLAQSVAGSLE